MAISSKADRYCLTPINIVKLKCTMLIPVSEHPAAVQEIPTGLSALEMTFLLYRFRSTVQAAKPPLRSFSTVATK